MRPALLTVLLLVAACAPEPSEVTPDLDTGAEAAFTDAPPPGTEQLVITSTDGAVELGLTDRVVFFRLSDRQQAEIEDEVAAETDAGRGGIGGFIAGTVADAVQSAIGQAVQLPVEDVAVTHDGQGRIEIESDGGGAASFGSGDEGGEPLFDPADAERFAQAFERVKAHR